MAEARSKTPGEKSALAVFLKALVAPLVTIGIALAATALTLAWDFTTPARFIENLTYDLRMSATAPAPRDDIVIVKMDDASMEAMQAQSACHCFAPVDKVWLADIVADLSAKGARSIALDILFSAWRTPEEYAAFVAKTQALPTPLIAAVDPALTPGTDYALAPNLRRASPNALVAREDDVVRVYDPLPDGVPSIAAEIMAAEGGRPPSGEFVMRYRRGLETSGENRGALAPSYPAALVKDLPAALFAGKTVLIGRVTRFPEGQSGILEDMHATPLRFSTGHIDGTPGVEVHAHALMQMKDGDVVIRPSLTWLALSVFAAALGGAALGRSSFRWWTATLVVAGALALVVVGGFLALAYAGVMISILAPVTAFGLAFFVQSRLAATQLEDERKLYSTALERYLAPQVIKRIEDGSEPVQIGAALRQITVLVTDLEDSSTLVATTPMADFATIINGYFDGLYEVLWKHEAMLDKLTGDGVIVLFGAPIQHPDHADRAIACARDMQVFSEKYRQEVRERFGIPFGRTRVGIHSGEGLVGNFGGEKRFNYTAYGQVVVIAARLEAANKEYDTTVLFSDAALERAKAPGEVKALGQITLKGVPQPITVYTPV
ncbi:MAG: adenylate/guanylate cyclase domain-containing protein [Hyphomonadaceae bacterium]|nr:adenylate/guanylate cyclase domain-containing protein [Hyphomonadaceae bacterium]